MSTDTARRLMALLLLGLLLVARPAQAQQSGVEIDVQREFLGLGGIVQRGVWTPVRVDLTNNGAENVEVDCRWVLSDEDGDELISERPSITLQPLRTLGVWLYATPPMSTRSNQTWTFQAVNAQNGELINQVQVQLTDSAVAQPSVNLVGVCGVKDLGLYPWRRWSTHHEELRLVQGLSLQTLPDRWYGLDSLSSLVWFPGEGGEPTDPRMTEGSKQALREWVYRGGHLVIILPYAGQQWTSADSGLSDLIEPLKPDAITPVKARPPISVFGVLRSTDTVGMNVFDLSNAPGYTSLAEVDITPRPATLPEGVSPPPSDFKPMIVGRRFGFGQVTLVGLDLSNNEVLKSIDAFRLHRVWTRIFSWRASRTGELIPNSELDHPDPKIRSQYWEAKDATQVELGNWMGSRVAREGDTGPAVGLAFVLFIIYALFAALTFPNLLKARGWQRHSWMLFVCIVALFSVVAWGGAWVMRPISTSASHFTVLDIDGNTNLVRAQSWQSLLIPSFSTADVEVASDKDGLPRMEVVNLLASPGNELSPDSPGYPDRRSYTFNATQPTELSVPMRSTTKSLKVDFLGQISGQQDGLTRPWDMPQASLRLVKSEGMDIPVGTITHDFLGELTDVRIIYCPGGAQQVKKAGALRAASRPLVYKLVDAQGKPIQNWAPGTPLALPNSVKQYTPLWERPIPVGDRKFRQEGYLGEALADRGFGESAGSSSANIVEDTPLLSFYGALPPPVYRTNGNNTFGGLGGGFHTYGRSMTRDLDLTHLITGRRIILIGHLKNGPSPVPLTIDGDSIPSQGWTVVRWIYDL